MTKTLYEMTGDYIDSRDLLDRLNELEGYDEPDDIEQEELTKLRAICEEGLGMFGDWEHGENLIPEDQFTDYAQELAEETGAISSSSDAQWPLYCIDWERAARDLRMDYSEIDIDGTTYLGRS